tara:strand:+ start:2153 stop:3088 length:936 start_codon:yes stop_codon:yes gene_type:complete
MYTPFKMKGKSPMVKKLIGKQHRLPEHLKAKIEAAPESPTKMKKKSPTKNKVNPFSAEYKRMTPSQRKNKYGFKTTKEGIEKKKITGSGKTGTLKTALDKVDKAISREKSYISIKKGEDKKIKVKIKKGDAPSNTAKKTVKKDESKGSGGFSGMVGGDAKYTYKKNADGSYTGKNADNPGKTFIIKEGEGGYDKLEKSGLKMKKSAMKLKKKSATKMKKSVAKLKKKTKGESLKKAVIGKKNTTARKQRIARNKEFLPIAIKKGLAPKRPKASDLSAKGRAELKAYEKFYSNKENVRKLNKAQKDYFKNKK